MRTGLVRGVTCATAVLAAGACAAPPNAATALSPSPVAAGPVTFAPGTARYRRASHLHVEQQVGGQYWSTSSPPHSPVRETD